MNDSVVISFGSSTGTKTKTLLQEKFHVIQRINIKANVSGPSIKVKKFDEIDLNIFKGLISKRRNQMLLQSFIGLNENQGIQGNFEEIRQNAHTQIKNINEELNTIKFLTANNNCAKFMAQTGASELQAEEYLQEFKGDVSKAIKEFNIRVAIINGFAKQHQMPLSTAKEIMKANNYNPHIFKP